MSIERPKDITIRGRLSFPKFTMREALEFNKGSDFAKPEDKVRPHFFLLLEQEQQDKLVTYIKDQFLPWCLAQEKAGNKAGEKSALSAAHVKKLTRILDEADWESDSVLGFIVPVHENTADLAPEAVAQVKVNGLIGRDVVQKAIVRSTDQLANPLDDIVIPERGLILPVEDTNLELYPGSHVAAQLNLWGFVAAGNPSMTASTSTAIFLRDDERFGGGDSLDEDDVFMMADD